MISDELLKDTLKDNRDTDEESNWRKIGIALSSGWVLASSLLISLLIGLGLDRLFHTRPVFLVTGFVFGTAAGLYSLIRELRRMG